MSVCFNRERERERETDRQNLFWPGHKITDIRNTKCLFVVAYNIYIYIFLKRERYREK